MKYVLIFMLIILSIGISSAKVSPATIESHGLHINTWDFDYLSDKENYSFLWDVDINGLLQNASLTNCTFFIHRSGALGAGTFVSGVATMTPDDRGWNKLITAPNFSKYGQYDFQIDCYLLSNTTISGNYLGSFIVNPTGAELTLGKAAIYISLLLLAIFLFVSGIIGGIALPSDYKRDEMTGYIIALNNLKYVKLFCYALSYLTLTVIFYFSYILSYAFLELGFVSDLLRFGFYFMLALLVPMFIVGLYILIANAVRDHQVAEQLTGGLRIK